MDEYVETETGNDQVGGGPHGGCRRDKLGLGLGWGRGRIQGKGCQLEEQGAGIYSSVTTGTRQ